MKDGIIQLLKVISPKQCCENKYNCEKKDFVDMGDRRKYNKITKWSYQYGSVRIESV